MRNKLWILDFEAASRRTLKQRINYSFIHTYKPVLDDYPYFRAFKSMNSYKKWMAKKLPSWLGYGKKV